MNVNEHKILKYVDSQNIFTSSNSECSENNEAKPSVRETRISTSSSETNESDAVALGTYKRRWAVLTITTYFLITVGYNRACFGVVENVYAHYFKVTVEAVDWLTLSMSAVSVVGCEGLLLILPFRDLGFRSYCLATSLFIVVTHGCHLAGSFHWKLFPICVIGQITMGIVNTIALVLIPLTAALWFPKEEIATAVGISLGGIAVGNVLGFNVPAHFLDNKDDLPDDEWFTLVRSRLIAIFLSLLVMSVLVFFATGFIVRDKPELPPSLSEAAKRKLKLYDEIMAIQSLWCRMAYYLKIVFYEKTFFALVVCFGVVETCYMLEVLMMADILRETRSELKNSTQSNVLAALFLSLYAAGAIGGGVVSGIILDRTKRFKAVAIVTGLIMVVFASLFSLMIYQDNINGGLASNFFYGFFNAACYTALYEIIVQHMYPCSEMALGSWITLFVNMAALFVPWFGRFIYNTLSAIGVLVLQAVVLLLATITIACLKPRYERYSMNKEEREISSLSTPLVQTKEQGRVIK
ncbi:unnamed protein product [Clavelina lepadiformis]|uniref:Major facilitator superfamily (MFS) profile domain-containing protein n=1 Tax=Clavelina lepadiformis TaxID=159417 RepID=A0ABP0F226_CLALP